MRYLSRFRIEIIDSSRAFVYYGDYGVLIESRVYDISSNPAVLDDIVKKLDRLIAGRCFVRGVVITDKGVLYYASPCRAYSLASAYPDADVRVFKI